MELCKVLKLVVICYSGKKKEPICSCWKVVEHNSAERCRKLDLINGSFWLWSGKWEDRVVWVHDGVMHLCA